MIWLLNDLAGVSFFALTDCLPLLSESRKTAVFSMKQDQTKVRSVLAELLLRYALRQEGGLTELPWIDTNERGKPYFPDCPDFQFNLSHCKTAVACALASAPVGVDVQEYRPLHKKAGSLSAPSQSLPLEGKVSPVRTLVTDEVVPREGTPPPVYRVLSEPERAWVEAGETAMERDRRFIRVWTCKEAYGKALGVGLGYPFRDTVFLPSAEPWTQDGFVFTHWDLPDAALTACAAGEMDLRVVSADQLISQFNGGR